MNLKLTLLGIISAIEYLLTRHPQKNAVNGNLEYMEDLAERGEPHSLREFYSKSPSEILSGEPESNLYHGKNVIWVG